VADWLDHLTEGLHRLTDLLDPGMAASPRAPEHRRGARLWAPATFPQNNAGRVRLYTREMARWERALVRQGDQPGLRIWGAAGLRRWQEEGHLLLLGAVGVGKTTILSNWLAEVVRRGDLVLCFDPKADLVAWLLDEFRDRSALLAPWDVRSVAWGLSNDVKTLLDTEEAARTMMPDVPGRDPFWHLAPQAILRGVMQSLVLCGRPWSFTDIWDVIVRGPDVAVQAIRRTPSGPLVAGILSGGRDGKRTSAQDVWSTIAARLGWLEHLANAWPSHGGFGVRLWTGGGGPHVLAVPVPRQYATLGTTVARLVVDVLARHLLSLPDSPQHGRRLWIFADEFSALGEVPSLAEILLRARSKGATVVAALQDHGMMRQAWGRDQADAVLNAFSTLIVLRLQDPGLSEWAARALGQREVIEHLASEQTQHRGQETSTSHGQSAHVREEYVAMPSEIQQLPVLAGYLRVQGWPIVRVRWSRVDRPRGAPVVVPAPWVRGPARPAAPMPPMHAPMLDGGLPPDEVPPEDDGGLRI